MSRAEWEGSPSLRGNPIPVVAREVRSGRVGLYGRPLVPPNGRRPFFLYVLPEVYETNRFSSSGVGVMSKPEVYKFAVGQRTHKRSLVQYGKRRSALLVVLPGNESFP